MSNSPILVAKFGGTSMGNYHAMVQSAEIAKKHQADLVCVSATSGTTNQLIEITKLALVDDYKPCKAIIKSIEERHIALAQEAKLNELQLAQLKSLFEELETLSKGIHLLRECTPKAFDSIQSLGERMSSLIFSQILSTELDKPVDWVDARQVIKTDSRFGKAQVNIAETKTCAEQILRSYCTHERVAVTQGFIGSTKDGQTTTLGRGGSDYSAALFAEAMSAHTLQIWTDVPGISTTDPRLTSKAKPIPEISYSEASELAVFGAKILHPTTLTPARRAGVSVFVGSTFDPDAPGTWIVDNPKETPLIRAMALRKNETLVTLKTPSMLAYGFLFHIFKIFNDHKISIDSITTSEISVSLTLDEQNPLTTSVIEELKEIAEVKIETDLSLISLIGNKVISSPGLSARIFTAIEGINVRMICLGASRHNYCFLVHRDDAPKAIELLHREFIA